MIAQHSTSTCWTMLRAAALSALLVPVGGSAAAEPQPGSISVAIVDNAFRIARGDGAVVEGEALVGTILTIAGAEEEAVQVRIDAVESDPTDPEVVLYGF